MVYFGTDYGKAKLVSTFGQTGIDFGCSRKDLNLFKL